MDKKIASSMKIIKRTEKIPPVPMNLSGQAGKRVVVSVAKRVIKRHRDVIKALAKR